ncbi:PoNe immunity protein domain-containing protein [Pseudomonas sp. ICMP 561]|uniref:PoNe immunity protein domain-containing protein n=1 Tax=Pseudomonas sp. ICMP 561 TaxID=1718918 RepID=UPI000C06F35D|nr:PoNe immunity protein domain-containing protein [Pseudomonas sp. ICMP 561]PHN26485.1 hypothetical protein AO242_26690 [Pseudomonas sp. ICMP 561]
MIRDSIADVNYWRERVAKDVLWIEKSGELLSRPSQNPVYDPQFSFDLSKDILRLMLRRYSQGDPISEIVLSFSELLDAWELSNDLAKQVCAEHNLQTCRDWVFDVSNLNHYIWCFWLVGLALALGIPDEQWNRLLMLIAQEGKDTLLDRIIASRQTSRIIGDVLLHAKPYARLLKAIDASEDQQAFLLHDFVDAWYPELYRRGKQQPWWYHYGDPEKNPLEMGSYFGRWCIEAIAAVEAFKLDDSRCVGHPHYPGDLLCPEVAGTHGPQKEGKKIRSLREAFGRRFTR